MPVDVRLIVVVNLPVDEEFVCAVITFPSLNRSYMMVCLEQTPTINFCRSRCSLSITSVWCKDFFLYFHTFILLIMFVWAFFFIIRCPDTNKPLGLMLLNGLTKLINEYKEVKQCKAQFQLQNYNWFLKKRICCSRILSCCVLLIPLLENYQGMLKQLFSFKLCGKKGL